MEDLFSINIITHEMKNLKPPCSWEKIFPTRLPKQPDGRGSRWEYLPKGGRRYRVRPKVTSTCTVTVSWPGLMDGPPPTLAAVS
jgi:hypothetical protein